MSEEIKRRRTFAIISHPDAGKTTLTEKLLLFGGAIQMAGTVKGRKAARHATSDWMRLEQERATRTAPVTWPIGRGRELRGIYPLLEDRIYVYAAGERGRVGENRTIGGLASAAGRDFLQDLAGPFAEEIELVRGATATFDSQAYRDGRQTPVFFGSAINKL